MPLIWTLLVAACLCAVLAGAQSIHLCRERDSTIARQALRAGLLAADLSSLRSQLDAQQIVLLQAQAWILAQSDKAQ